MRQPRIDTVRHPAHQRQAVARYGLRGQQRMVQTPFLNAHYHQHRQLLLHYPVGKRA